MAKQLIFDEEARKKIKTGAADGVTNVFIVLNAAKANGRKVNVYIKNNQIEQVTLT